MKLFCVFGNPIAHSKSPILHNYVFSKLNIDAIYSRYLLEDDSNFRDLFFSLSLSGANITLPYKESLIKHCDEIRGIAKDIGAINTIIKEDSKLIGYNTDGMGFYQNIINEKISNALIIGAGGSAKAIAIILKQNNIKTSITNRSQKNLEFFKNAGFETYLNNEIPNKNFDIIINATSSSIKKELPISKEKLQNLFINSKITFDLMYGVKCEFLELAKQNNIKTINGAKMLLYQAIFASNLFLNIPINEISKTMQKAYQIIES